MIFDRTAPWVLATHNVGKIAEIRNLLEPYGLQLETAKEHHLSEPVENAQSFLGNARIKAHYVCAHTNKIALADDSGLCIEALNGEPGVESSSWAVGKDFKPAMERVLKLLGPKKDLSERRAFFQTILVVADPQGQIYHCQGRVEGHIAFEILGDQGFGYDGIFIPDGDTRSFAQMDLVQKKNYSHRGKAFQQLIQDLLS
jgi:XTP/dITP diphosphohydrolase